MIQDGYHVPTLIAEGDKQPIITAVEPFAKTHEGRAQQLFVLGFTLAQLGEIGVLQQVFLITEAWMSVAQDGELPDVAPSQDPQRKEILVVSRQQVRPPKTETVIFEMKRNEEGTLIAVESADYSFGHTPEHAESPLLDAFVHGFLANSFPRTTRL